MITLLAKLVSASYINLTYSNGKAFTFHKDHASFNKIKTLVNASRKTGVQAPDTASIYNFEFVEDLYSQTKALVNYVGDTQLQFVNGAFTFDGKPVTNKVTDHIIKLKNEGFNVEYMIKFLDNLLQNPLPSAVEELYLFLEFAKLPITEDGCFLAYKKVGKNFKDLYSGKFDHSVGKVVREDREHLDTNRNNTCSKGLHFCSIAYLPNYGNGESDNIVIVKINPKDVIAIPSDYNNTKGRCCEYEVIGLHGVAKEVQTVENVLMKKAVVNVKKSMAKRDASGRFIKAVVPKRDARGRFLKKVVAKKAPKKAAKKARKK